MKNNKGFTLAELLAIIVLISVFALIVGPNLTKQIQSSDKEGKNVLTQKIYNASLIYAGKYYADKIITGEEVPPFTLNNLIKDGLLDLDEEQCVDVRNNNIIVDSDGQFEYSGIESDDCYKSTEIDDE